MHASPAAAVPPATSAFAFAARKPFGSSWITFALVTASPASAFAARKPFGSSWITFARVTASPASAFAARKPFGSSWMMFALAAPPLAISEAVASGEPSTGATPPCAAALPENFQSSPARTVLVPLVPPSMSAERIASLPLASAEPPARVASVGMTVRPAAPDRSSTSEGPPPVRSLAAMRVDAIAPPNENDLLIRWSTPSDERRPASPVRTADASSALRSKPRSAPLGSEFSWRRNAASLIARWTTFARASFDMSLLLRRGVAGRLTVRSGRFVHPYDASSVMLMTFLDVVSSPSARSLELRQIDRVAARPAYATVERVFDYERPQHLM